MVIACLGRNNLTGYCPNTCSECINKGIVNNITKKRSRSYSYN